MADDINPYQTLPTVAASGLGEARAHKLQLTLLFHPQVSRIGEIATIEKPAGNKPYLLGREYPGFGREGSVAQPLADRYVSREALSIGEIKGALVLSRAPSSSRVQVDGDELGDELQLDDARLEAGVAILIGGRIVLLLRWVEQYASSDRSTSCSGAMQGRSAYMQRLRMQIARLARTDLDLLIRGETGTGKELVAEAVHGASDRAAGKMIAVNMAAIPVSLAPSMLFGNAKGAFSGADKATLGYFREANGGTLFLDEVGDTPIEIQAQLLRVLQQREVQSVGGPIHKVSLRVISATDAPLDSDSCGFKAALRHRLGESEITLLPLREHLEDLGELLWFFLNKTMATMQRQHLLPDQHSGAKDIARWAEVFYRFARYSWPGNIRELENFAQQLVVASENKVTIPDTVNQKFSRQSGEPGGVSVVSPAASSPQPVTDQVFRAGLEKANYEVAPTARQLGISRQSVYRRIADAPDLCLASELSVDSIQAALHRCGGDINAAALQLKVSRSGLRVRLRYLPQALAG